MKEGILIIKPTRGNIPAVCVHSTVHTVLPGRPLKLGDIQQGFSLSVFYVGNVVSLQGLQWPCKQSGRGCVPAQC